MSGGGFGPMSEFCSDPPARYRRLQGREFQEDFRQFLRSVYKYVVCLRPEVEEMLGSMLCKQFQPRTPCMQSVVLIESVVDSCLF